MPKAKVLLLEALKAAKNKRMPRATLQQTVVDQLVAAGKSKKKAEKAVAAKLELPIFGADGADVVLRKKDAAVAEEAPVAPASKRKAADDVEPPAKKAKKKDKSAAPIL